jgi:hypothetical protein
LKISSSLSTSDNVGKDGASWKIPFDIILEVAAFCAGSFEFQTYLNLSLACKEVHKSLNTVLDEPLLVWDKDTLLWDGFCGARMAGSLKQYLHDVGKDLPDQALYWSKVRYVTWTTCSSLYLKSFINRYLVIYDACPFDKTGLYPLNQLFALFSRLRCVIGSGQRRNKANCQTVLFDTVSVSTLASLVRGAASLLSSTYRKLRPESLSSETIKTMYLAFSEISPTESAPVHLTVLRPVCDSLVSFAPMDSPIVDIGTDMKSTIQLALFFRHCPKAIR